MNADLLQVFDRICIINLPERRDRRDAVIDEFARLGIKVDGQRVRFVNGIRPSHAAGFPNIGAHGCFLSHLQILVEAQADGVQRLLVLEDDVMFMPHKGDSSALLPALQGDAWHIAYPGHVQEAEGGPLRWVLTQAPLVCAHCYALHAQALPLAIAHLQACLSRPSGHPLGSPMHYDGALTLLRRQHPELRTLLASRSLAGQRSSRSDIIGPSWLDNIPIPNLAPLARAMRNGWRRLAAGF
ncbi:glycosyltransferase family 25 protein [Roseateles albus]|uniref:Glycosyltransferase family 25 protein n=1 Tax=Roseateles albus TaxID=2987525 RepID=A0ABT5KGD1_9BURK|nr:glycosyltransferase family 25 protein [Roseateles albus]MDC8772993.1 glycosyltransferase family 25 protein [Roseateles albus]